MYSINKPLLLQNIGVDENKAARSGVCAAEVENKTHFDQTYF